MSNDTYTEVTSQSWFGRLGNSIKNIVFGFVLVIVAFGLLAWNEGRSVKRYRTLNEGSRAVITVAAERVDDANGGKLVHVIGLATTDETLADPEFRISANAIKLERVAEMYQWKEEKDSKTKKKVGGGTTTETTYTYTKVWSASLIDSGEFKKPEGHSNPGAMRYGSQTLVADRVTLGAFVLSRGLVDKMRVSVALNVDAASASEKFTDPMPIVQGGGYYFGKNPASPEIGDLKVAFRVVKPQEVSLVARQVQNTFEPYTTHAGGTIELLEPGVRTSQSLFEQAQKENAILTWVLRLVGFVLMVLGFAMIFGPLGVLADVIPFLGSIVSAGTGLVALTLSLVLSSITIAVSWLAVRPLVGIPLLVAGLAVLVLALVKLPKRGKGAAAAAK